MGHRTDEEYRRLLVVLTAHIRRHPLSQLQLGRNMGVSKSYLPKLLAGKVNPTFRKLLKILDAVNLSFSELATKSEVNDAESLLEAFLPPGLSDPPVIVRLKRKARWLVGQSNVPTSTASGLVAAHLGTIEEADELRYKMPWIAACQVLSLAENVWHPH